jgi:predicted transcriptional regulator
MRFLVEDQPQFRLPVWSLITLEASGIPGGRLAMRPLNPWHVEDLLQSDPSTWPAIQVTKTEQGYLLIDGYHRRQAATQREITTLVAECRTYSHEHEVIEAAFQANLAHGLKASRQTRGDYAYWLHLTSPDLRQEEIAERVGITQSVVSKAIARREATLKRAEKPADLTRQRTRTCRHLTRTALKLVSELEASTDEDTLRHTLDSLVKREADRQKLVRLGQLLIQSVPKPQ